MRSIDTDAFGGWLLGQRQTFTEGLAGITFNEHCHFITKTNKNKQQVAISDFTDK